MTQCRYFCSDLSKAFDEVNCVKLNTPRKIPFNITSNNNIDRCLTCINGAL